MTTKTTTTESGKTIKIEMVRKVQDKVAYLDGYNMVSGREIVEYTTITIIDKDGKVLESGSHLETLNPKFDASLIAKGAVGRLGNSLMRQPMYDIIAGLLAAVDAETPKSDEQIAIETKKAQAAAKQEAFYSSAEQIAARNFRREMEREDSDY